MSIDLSRDERPDRTITSSSSKSRKVAVEVARDSTLMKQRDHRQQALVEEGLSPIEQAHEGRVRLDLLENDTKSLERHQTFVAGGRDAVAGDAERAFQIFPISM
jgi:hypothetical protein